MTWIDWQQCENQGIMASIHIREIFQLLSQRGEKDASPFESHGEGFFIEILFQDEQYTRIALANDAIDTEYANQVLTVDTAFGTATILFDEAGRLKSIDIC